MNQQPGDQLGTAKKGRWGGGGRLESQLTVKYISACWPELFKAFARLVPAFPIPPNPHPSSLSASASSLEAADQSCTCHTALPAPAPAPPGSSAAFPSSARGGFTCWAEAFSLQPDRRFPLRLKEKLLCCEGDGTLRKVSQGGPLQSCQPHLAPGILGKLLWVSLLEQGGWRR